MRVRLSHRRGAVATITLLLSKRGLWCWQWEEEWLGMKTLLKSSTGYRHRPDCVASLGRALHLLGLADIAHEMATWE